MVVDDAIVARRLLARWIDAEPDMAVAASLRTGREAVDQIERSDPDVVVLDIDMPDLDGIAALPLLLEKKPDLVVIMASTLTRRSAEISLRALSLGAADYVPKPETAHEAPTLGAVPARTDRENPHLGRARPARRASARRRLRCRPRPRRRRRAQSRRRQHEPPAFTLRPFAVALPRALADRFLDRRPAGAHGPDRTRSARPSIAAPVLITQHMPPTFTAVLAEHLARISGRPVREAEHGEPVAAGRIYVAPGGRHMRVVRGADGPVIALGDDPPINFCRPAVDPLVRFGGARCGARAVWRSFSPAWAPTARAAPPRSPPPAAA